MFLFKPAQKTVQNCKFARMYHGPFRVCELETNTAKMCRVDRPQDDSIIVTLARLYRRCSEEIPGMFWPQPIQRTRTYKRQRREVASTTDRPPEPQQDMRSSSSAEVKSSNQLPSQRPHLEVPNKSKWAGRLRSCPSRSKSQSRTSVLKTRVM